MFHTVPLFDLHLVWVGAYGCILDLLWFDLLLHLVWCLVLCAIHAFHNIWELATPIWLLEDSPPTTFGILRSPLWIHGYYAEDFDLIWFVWLVVKYWYNLNLYLILILYIRVPQCNIYSVPHFYFILLCCYICSLSFLSSAAFLLPRQVLEGSWVLGQECK